jgi:hypothetical protein
MTNNSSAVRGGIFVALWWLFGGSLVVFCWVVAIRLVGFLNKLE